LRSETRELAHNVVADWSRCTGSLPVPGPRNEPMIRMSSDCGIRVGEMLRAAARLQDLKTGVFRVRATAWSGAVLDSSREKNHDREGPIPPSTLALPLAMPTRIDWPSHEELQPSYRR
jgi:hypothetical protein